MVNSGYMIFRIGSNNFTPYTFQVVLEIQAFDLPVVSANDSNSPSCSQVTTVFPYNKISIRAYQTQSDFAIEPDFGDKTKIDLVNAQFSI